jgi:hypothetical protein
MLDSVDLADIHGQFKFSFKNDAIFRDDSQRFLDFAFWHDFERNGPSLYRMCETMLKGWKRYRDYPDPRVRERFEREIVKLRSGYNAALWAMEHQLRSINSSVSEQIQSLRKKWKRNLACPRASGHISSARSCYGWRAAKNAARPQAKPTNRQRSSNAPTGHPRRAGCLPALMSLRLECVTSWRLCFESADKQPATTPRRRPT